MSNNEKSASWENPRPSEIREIIENSKVIAIVGLSSKKERASHRVGAYLQKQGFEIIPVNPREEEVLGRKAFPDLKSIDKKIDIVDVFRKGEDTPPIVQEAIDIGAGCIWLQLGIVSQDSYNLARSADVPIVMDKCMLQEHKKMRGAGNG